MVTADFCYLRLISDSTHSKSMGLDFSLSNAAEMDDGSLIGGVYGSESFSSLAPHREDLFIENEYHINDSKEFIGPIHNNIGTWINGDKVNKLHFYRAN